MDNTNDVSEHSASTDGYVSFNINENVRVKLTDHGRKVHREDHERFWKSVGHPDPPEYTPPVEDEDGWSVWQMWVLMESFGQYISMGNKNVFDTTIGVKLST